MAKPSASAGCGHEPHAFPWDDALTLTLSILRWSPETFWRATPRELVAAWDGLQGTRKSEPALSGDLRRLMNAFPDEGSDESHGVLGS
ncbi:phage tail assembly chaperone [Microvirga sp. CF3016]|uniref:phage tail assembly chaperone n=1 Tax=Microvirga sp. CF3016 TaxID=3110181 RepID=UPI002E7A7061|nr:phage tail assembly chaperone [Microvirga sp. CF3016]MEE1611220.1 phage tail assembly chaperone [Microvirga sp. CF3016]